jgi:hypothetical protein
MATQPEWLIEKEITLLQIITSPPVNVILKVFSYAPTLETDRAEPLALLDQPVAMPI